MMTMDAPKRRWTSGDKTLLGACACLGLFALSLLGGASWEFAALSGIYVASVMLAVACVGGIASLFGVVVLYFSMQHVLVSQVAKVLLGEAPDSRLFAPIPTMATEILTMLGFALAGLCSRYVRPNRGRPLFPPITNLGELNRLAAAATMLAVIRILVVGVAGVESAGPLRLLTVIDALAIAAAVAASLTASGGQRLTSRLVWYSVLPIVFFSLVGGNRQGVFASFISIGLTGWAFGYRFRFSQFVFAVGLALTMFFIISPYGLQIREKARTKDFGKNVAIAQELLYEVVTNPMKYQYATSKDLRTLPKTHYLTEYYSIPIGNLSGILERFSLIKLNDLVVDNTLKEGTTGWANVTPGLTRLLPSFLAPSKTYLASGNALLHRVPGAGGVDYTTGITIGLEADCFSAFKYWGTFLIPFGLLLANMIMFKVLTSLDLRRNIFAVGIAYPIASAMSEQTITNILTTAVYGIALSILCYYMATRAAVLFDFRYLRPRSVPTGWGEEEPGVRV